jgi:hypothetical protein
MGSGLVAALHDLASEVRRLLDRLADHEKAQLHLMLVHQVKDAGHALKGAVLEEGVGWQIRETFLDRVRDDTGHPRSADRQLRT